MQESGCFQRHYRMVLRDGTLPVIQPARRVPLALTGQLRDELERMEREGIITKDFSLGVWPGASRDPPRSPTTNTTACLRMWTSPPSYQAPSASNFRAATSTTPRRRCRASLDRHVGYESTGSETVDVPQVVPCHHAGGAILTAQSQTLTTERGGLAA
ncbi:uncharacterized protein [Dermacentor albipictus]|uniref:uncharacterized protein n=1 Tax=Dermacentor albipictus TaxID=60249 RepID=UPI0031FD6BBD